MNPAQFARLSRGLLHGAPSGGVLCAFLDGDAVERGAHDVATAGACARATGGAPTSSNGALALAWRIPRDGTLTPERLLNHAARPLLRWLKSMKVPASYFGRDALVLPDGEVARIGLGATADAFLVEARFAHAVALDVHAPAPPPARPGDRRPGKTLVSTSRHVPVDGEALRASLLDVLRGEGFDEAGPSPVDEARVEGDFSTGVACALGRVRATREGRVAGPFMASDALCDDVAKGMSSHGEPARAVLDAMARPGAFILGADPEHVVAALEEARGA